MKKIAIITALAFASLATLSACKENTQSAPAEEAAAASSTKESDLKAAYTTDDETLWVQYYDCVCEAADVMDAATEANITEQIAKLEQIVRKMNGIRAEFDKLGGALCPGSEEAVKQCTDARSRAKARYNEAAKSVSERELGHSRGRLQDAAAGVSAIFALPVAQ
ncbi:MAG: hypothetical protein E7033_04235 [Akkermansiaceae bacterium]|nr:hypothetical protein [Akkermansiaceae bacterium]